MSIYTEIAVIHREKQKYIDQGKAELLMPYDVETIEELIQNVTQYTIENYLENETVGILNGLYVYLEDKLDRGEITNDQIMSHIKIYMDNVQKEM